jgi:hypothetical protein
MATITVKYSELLTLSVMQLFYSNQICRAYQSTPVLDFAIVPTAECLNYMKAKNLVFKSMDTAGGFIIMARTFGTNMAGDDLLRYTVTDGDKLTFFMVLNNPDVVNFDVLPTQITNGNVYYFSNQVIDNAALRSNLHLSQNPAGVDGNVDQVKTASTNYSFNYAGVATTGEAVVKHLLTGATINAKSATGQGTQTVLAFDLSVLPSGCCQLLINNVLTDSFYFLGTMASQQVFGVIELSLSAALASNYRIVETDMSLTPIRPSYSVLFNNRATTWRYTIQLQTNSPVYLEMAALTAAQKADYINQFTIACNDASIRFKMISNTDLSFVFVSLNTIALQERYTLSTGTVGAPMVFTLYKYFTTSKKEVKPSLPCPSTSSIDATSPPAIYSDIFITI